MKSQPIYEFARPLDLHVKLSEDILRIASASISLHDKFTIVLAGGSSLDGAYEILRKSDSDWSKWHIYFTDERAAHSGVLNSNGNRIKRAWLEYVAIPTENIHFFRTELGLDECRALYESKLKGVHQFDLTLISAGADGHVASLFPGREFPEDSDVVIETRSPKWPSERVSLSYSRLNRSRTIFKIICGAEKRGVFEKLLNDVPLPITKVGSSHDPIYVCVSS